MIRYDYVKLPHGAFKALRHGVQNDGNLSAADGYVLERDDEESLTLRVSNPRGLDDGAIHHVPWTSVQDSAVSGTARKPAKAPASTTAPTPAKAIVPVPPAAAPPRAPFPGQRAKPGPAKASP